MFQQKYRASLDLTGKGYIESNLDIDSHRYITVFDRNPDEDNVAENWKPNLNPDAYDDDDNNTYKSSKQDEQVLEL